MKGGTFLIDWIRICILESDPCLLNMNKINIRTFSDDPNPYFLNKSNIHNADFEIGLKFCLF